MRKLKQLFLVLFSFIDLKDIFVFSGLASLWYGVHLYSDALAFSVLGVLLMTFGFMLRAK